MRGHYADIIISCFVILADNRVIKYNQDGIALKAVEIGAEYITLTYGTDSVLKKTHITYERPEGWDMAAIAERFHYETGVLPEIKERR